MANGTTPAAVWARVSTEGQDPTNQLLALAAHREYDVVTTYELHASAWKGHHHDVLKQALDDAHRGRFKVLIVFALDRLSREGAEATLRVVRQFRERGVAIISHEEPWLTASPEIQDVLLAFAGWMAQQSSKRKSENIKAGLAKRKAQGLPVGRQPGAKDRKPRKRSGYMARWERQRAGREDA
ncbi:recombinase family protein [Haloechinothrix salitolerans]|uniref:Recombinase family protein n=1 Tax=Haloechinothrix salitolerans TaxID=926830 RepID=A0ABW2C9H6_9PSEU